MDKTVKKYKLKGQPKECCFWRKKSAQERLAALEEIRSEYNGWKYNARQGLQRVYRIVKQK